jgi:hypothetical protein
LVKDGKFVESPDKMFNNPIFRQFITGLIEETKANKTNLYTSTFSLFYDRLNPSKYSDKTNLPLSSWDK